MSFAQSEEAAIVIETNGSIRSLTRAELRPTLQELQAAVGGYIEVIAVPFSPGTVLLVNEDGLRDHNVINSIASRLGGQAIVGPAILISKSLLQAESGEE